MSVYEPVPLSRRPVDLVILIFFWVNLLVVTYMIDLEQLVIADPANFSYPFWPPSFMVDAVHWWGANFDPVLLARPPWWKATIWIDAVFFGPFYVFAIYAYTRGREWIRMPSVLYAAMLFTNVVIILSEEYFGPHATPAPGLVFLANLAWLVFPIVIVWRMWRPHPFTKKSASRSDS